VNFTGLGTIATDAFGFSCATGVQFSGTVTPDDYKGLVIMKRTLVQGALYDGVSGQVGTYPSAGHPPDDTASSVKAFLLANTELAGKISETVAENVAADFVALSPLE
jgi:hypothetical protein